MKIVISVGGRLLTKELSAENFKKYTDVVNVDGVYSEDPEKNPNSKKIRQVNT